MTQKTFRTLALSILLGLWALSASALMANATTAGICYQVRNVESWDVLNIRIQRSAKSKIIGSIPPTQHGIIAKEGFCEPKSLPVNSRWCQIAYYNGNITMRGYVKRRFLEQSECP